MSLNMEAKDLEQWLVKELPKEFTDSKIQSIRSLAYDAQSIVINAYAQKNHLRPSKIKEALKSLELHYRKAALACEALSDEGMLLILVAAKANRVSEGDIIPHIIYLNKMAELTKKALTVSEEQVLSTQDYKGGRQSDARIRAVVIGLASRYQELLGIKPDYWINQETRVGEGLFMMFVKEALRMFAPDNEFPGSFTIDRAIHQAIIEFEEEDESLIKLEDILPPPLFS